VNIKTIIINVEKIADKKNILWVLAIGPEEIRKNKITIRNLKSGEQNSVDIQDVPKIIIDEN
ncbi:MAG: His/Gly/Thr/Pro-type tRNA ligase C-terminal domain-containing protein, partial [Elusimicrobiota bacterium]